MFEAVAALLDRVIQFLRGVERKKSISVVVLLLIMICVAEGKTHILASIGPKNDTQVLSALLELENQGIMNSQHLKDEYLDLVERYRRQRYPSLHLPVSQLLQPSSPQERLWKFLAGCLPVTIIALAFLFTSRGTFRSRIGPTILVLFIALALGGLSMLVPTVHSPPVTYTAISVAQVLLLVVVSIRSSKVKQKRSTTTE